MGWESLQQMTLTARKRGRPMVSGLPVRKRKVLQMQMDSEKMSLKRAVSRMQMWPQIS